MTTKQSQRQPTLYIPHGAGPCFFMDWNPADTWLGMGNFLKGIAATLPQRPAAIVMVSAHWIEPQFSVTAQASPELYYDYYGFPQHTYELRYPAPGEPALAQRIAGLLDQAALPTRQETRRGFDHGMFIPLKLMFPEADIPVVQLSLRAGLDARAHLEAGKALAALRDENILIVGSGMSFHNMRGYGDERFSPISDEFDEWLSKTLQSPGAEREKALLHWTDAPRAAECHPPGAEEHFTPLFVTAGAGSEQPGRKTYSERVMKTTISAFRFD